MSENTNKFIISTREGRLYIKTSDFFRQKEIKETIQRLLKSDIIKEIDKRNKKKSLESA